MTIEAMKQALEALDAITDDVDGTGLNTNMSFDKSLEAITALRQAIEQAEKQEPVAMETVYETIIRWDEGGGKRSRRELARRIVGLYTTSQPQREWVGLTDEDAVLAEREACAKVCDQFINETQKILPVEKLRETDPYKAFYKANAARIIQDTIRARGGNT